MIIRLFPLSAIALMTLTACRQDVGEARVDSPIQPNTSVVNVKADTGAAQMNDAGPKQPKTDSEWRKCLTKEQYDVLRGKATERPFSGEFNDNKEPGVYKCAGCGAILFHSNDKFDSGCGWPSFAQPMGPDAIKESPDTSHGMTRTETLCAKCDGHLGHVFNDGPKPRGLRYCINSTALKFEEAKGATVDKPQGGPHPQP